MTFSMMFPSVTFASFLLFFIIPTFAEVFGRHYSVSIIGVNHGQWRQRSLYTTDKQIMLYMLQNMVTVPFHWIGGSMNNSAYDCEDSNRPMYSFYTTHTVLPILN